MGDSTPLLTPPDTAVSFISHHTCFAYISLCCPSYTILLLDLCNSFYIFTQSSTFYAIRGNILLPNIADPPTMTSQTSSLELYVSSFREPSLSCPSDVEQAALAKRRRSIYPSCPRHCLLLRLHRLQDKPLYLRHQTPNHSSRPNSNRSCLSCLYR